MSNYNTDSSKREKTITFVEFISRFFFFFLFTALLGGVGLVALKGVFWVRHMAASTWLTMMVVVAIGSFVAAVKNYTVVPD